MASPLIALLLSIKFNARKVQLIFTKKRETIKRCRFLYTEMSFLIEHFLKKEQTISKKLEKVV
jgi:hypothetical protein